MDEEAALQQHYDAIAKEYDAVAQPVEDILSILKLPPHASALDVGCGTGNLTFRLPHIRILRRVVGVDVSDGVLSIAKKRAHALRLNNVEFIRASASQLPFDNGEFDAVVSNMVFHLIPNQEKAFAEVIRVLKSEGLAVLKFMGGGEVLPEMMRLFHQAWNEVLPEKPPPCLFYPPAVETVEKHLANLGVEAVEIAQRHNTTRVTEADAASWLNFFQLVAGFWRKGITEEAAAHIDDLLADKVMKQVKAEASFSVTVDTLLVEFKKTANPTTS